MPPAAMVAPRSPMNLCRTSLSLFSFTAMRCPPDPTSVDGFVPLYVGRHRPRIGSGYPLPGDRYLERPGDADAVGARLPAVGRIGKGGGMIRDLDIARWRLRSQHLVGPHGT